MSRRIEVEIVGDARSLERAFGRAGSKTGLLGSAFHRLGRAAMYAGAALAAGAVVGIEKSIHAAIDAEASQARLAQAFKNAGLSVKPYLGSLERVEKSSRKLGFTDTQVREVLGSLIAASGKYSVAVKDLSVAQDLARFKHLELTDASKMLTMAMTGSQRAAKQLGIIVIPATAHVDALKRSHVDLTTALGKNELAQAKLQDKMALGQAVIDQVTAKTHGQAKAFSETAAGSLAQFRAQFEHLQVTLGKVFLPIFTSVMGKASGWATSFGESIQRNMPQIRANLASLGAALREVGTAGLALGKLAISPGGSSLLLGGLAAAGTASAVLKVKEGLLGTTGVLSRLGPAGIVAAAGVGAVVAAFIMIRREGTQASAAVNSASLALDRLKQASDNAAQAHLNLGQARLNVATTSAGVKAAEDAYAASVKKSGANSADARAKLLGLQQARQSHKQALLDEQRAVEANSKATAENRRQHAEAAAKVAAVAEKFRALNAEYNSVAAAAGRISGASQNVNRQMRASLVQQYADAMSHLSAQAAKVSPKLWAAAAAASALASSLGRIPTRKEINIFVRTFQVGKAPPTVGGRPYGRQHGGFVPGGRGEPVPIMAHAGEIILNPAQQSVLGGPKHLAELFGFRGSEGPGFASGGHVKKKKHISPHLPGSIREAEARAAGTPGLGDDIAAYTSEQRWVEGQLKRSDLTPRERESLKVRKIRVSNRLKSLRTRQQNKAQKDYSQLPANLQYRIARARLTGDKVALRAALTGAKMWLQSTLRTPGLSWQQKTDIINALISINDELAQVIADDNLPPGTVDNADLQAQLDQANARTASATRRAQLAEAWGATGVFSEGAASGAGGGGSAPISFNFLIPDAEQIRRATEAIAAGAGAQPYRTSSVERTGM